MGCDYYADKHGQFWLRIYDYKTSKLLQEVQIKNLRPNNELTLDVLVGEER